MRLPTGLLFAAMYCLPATSPANEMVKLVGTDGATYKAFAVGSEDSNNGVLLVHDWFGLSEATKDSATRLAQKGARVVAVDLFKGQSARDHEQAERLMNQLGTDDVQGAINAALAALERPDRPVTVIGYSMGGLIALEAAVNNPERIQAAALVYGGGYEGVSNERFAAFGKPILVISGSADEWSYPELLKLQDRAHELGTPVESYVYPGANHAFEQMLFNEGKNFDPIAKEAAETVLDSFVLRTLQSRP